MRISDWSSDVCSSDLRCGQRRCPDEENLGAAYRDAQGGGAVGTEGECVQRADVPEAGEDGEQCGGYTQPDVFTTHAGEVAEQPKHGNARLLGGGSFRNHKGGQRIAELGAGTAEDGTGACREKGEKKG